MSLHSTIKESIKDAMRAKDTVRLSVLRGLTTSFVNELITLKEKPDGELNDEAALTVIAREAKKHRESIAQFDAAGRTDLSEGEKAELAIIETFLPEQMSREEIVAVVQKKKEELNADASQKGVFIGAVMKELKGKADGKIVQEVVNELLG